MNEKTESIVLGLHKHGDNSSILHAYTRAYGRINYMVYGNKWKATLTPMSIVEIVSQSRATMPIAAISSVERLFVPQKQDVQHHCAALFMAEAVEKSVRHPMADEELFDWLTETIKKLDQTDELQSFPDTFMTRLSELLGYGGAVLDEWRDLKSLDIVQTVLL